MAKLYEPGKNMIVDVALGFITAQVLFTIGNSLYSDIISPLIDTIPEEGGLQLINTEIAGATLNTGSVLNVLLYVVTILIVAALFLKFMTLDLSKVKTVKAPATGSKPAAKKAPAKKTSISKK